jgi:predicted AlkP superfamily pyrophosphatase or phosphodiesterase
MKIMRLNIALIALLFSASICAEQATPRLTVIMVIDQFAYHYFYKLKPFFKGAFKFFLNEGISFENAHYPHAVPETAPGHVCLNTGVIARAHGIVGNVWLNDEGKEVESDDGDPKTSGVFAKDCQMHSFGKSPGNIMVDGLSDQYVMKSQPNDQHLAYSLSIKSRSAIMTSTKLGKAIWLDKDTGMFTSSKAYFEQLPPWLTNFNDKNKVACTTAVSWDLRYDRSSPAYQFKNIENYKYIGDDQPSVGKEKTINRCSSGHSEVYAPIYESPFGNYLLLNLARECAKVHLKKNNKLLLWVCLTPLDLIGHRYGPDSLEAIDMIYHLDHQIKSFMQDMQHLVGKNNVVFALTADHGVMPMQGVLQEEGMTTSFRIPAKEVISTLNQKIKNKFNVDALLTNFQPPAFYVNHEKKKKIDSKVWLEVVDAIKAHMNTIPGVKNVWTYQELDTLPINPIAQELEYYYKNQRYPGRSGDIFVQPQPYSFLTTYAHGTTHASPYNYDTHVPLFIYQKGKFERKVVTQKVHMTQFANTMAQVLGVPKPSASTADLLPGVFAKVEEKPKAETNAQKQEHIESKEDNCSADSSKVK